MKQPENRNIFRLQKELNHIIDKKLVLSDTMTRLAYAPDAGCYSKIPQLVLKPENEKEVSLILQNLSEKKVPVTFRSAGTSLSGQAISDSVLLVATGDKWSKASLLENGKFIRTQPGITGSGLNQMLEPFHLKFGPDPASVNSALVGGIIANNASGMSCGTHANSYATIESARIVFADGSVLDTSDPVSRDEFRSKKKEIIMLLENIRDRIKKKPGLEKKIREKYKIKNTIGYGMNSFVDFDDPVDILLHLMVGSEGTLGFVSEATFRTVELLEFRASSLVYFKDLESACNAVPALKNAGISAIELMDRQALRSVENKKGIPEYIKNFPPETTALLIDIEARDPESLTKLIYSAGKALESFDLLREFEITTDKKQILEFWKIRKGVFPSVGGTRKEGTVVIIEDVAVKMEHLTNAVLDLRKLLDENAYGDSVIYGHALDGNLHFIFSQDFEDEKELARYKHLIEVLGHLIVDKYQGSLKAEHGTGLNMAPFVEYEWGEDIYGMMKEIKETFDPLNILNPGVIINDDKEVHLKNFKKIPQIDSSVDTCIECGFCEVNCLSAGFTLSARQRIVLQRSLKLAEQGKLKLDPREISQVKKDFRYSGDKTCAGDGLCSITCPLGIDTGVMIKNLREKKIQEKRNPGKYAAKIANNFSFIKKMIAQLLGVLRFFQKIFGNKILKTISSFLTIISFKKLPLWDPFMPFPVQKRKLNSSQKNSPGTRGVKVVYFPSCINQTMGQSAKSRSSKSVVEVTVEVLNRAGYEVVFPKDMEKLCCGTPWESKGFFDIADMKTAELEKELLSVSNNGEYPVLCDTSPCIYRMKKKMTNSLKLYEPVEFIYEFLLDKLDFHPVNKQLAFHTTCTTTKMELDDVFREVASRCVTNPVFPSETGCCGFAGDKGFTLPELNEYALRKLKPAVESCANGYSNSRTCEIGLSKTSGIEYMSIMYLVEEVTSSKKSVIQAEEL